MHITASQVLLNGYKQKEITEYHAANWTRNWLQYYDGKVTNWLQYYECKVTNWLQYYDCKVTNWLQYYDCKVTNWLQYYDCKVTNCLQYYDCKVTNYPLYSPDLGPSNFHLFAYFKKHLTGKEVATDPNIMQAVTSCIDT
jgi:hypothetical protein